MANKKLVHQIVHNYYEQISFLKWVGKEPTITLREYLEGIMLTEPKVYTKADVEYGITYSKSITPSNKHTPPLPSDS